MVVVVCSCARHHDCLHPLTTMNESPLKWTLGLLAFGAVSLVGYMVITKPDGSWSVVAASIQGLATIALVWVTTRYAGMVEDQAKSAQESAEATRRSAEATELMA